jgi:hypothetical protein
MNEQSQRLMRAITGPVIMITVGLLFLAEKFAGIRFSQSWPVLLIVIGLLRLLGGGRRRSWRYNDGPPPPPPPPPPAAPGVHP